jgi:hypothetical protein
MLRRTANSDQGDEDGNGRGDACEEQPEDPDDEPVTDSDGDGVADVADNCPLLANSDQQDSDGDGTGDVCADEEVKEPIVEPVQIPLCGAGSPMAVLMLSLGMVGIAGARSRQRHRGG